MSFWEKCSKCGKVTDREITKRKEEKADGCDHDWKTVAQAADPMMSLISNWDVLAPSLQKEIWEVSSIAVRLGIRTGGMTVCTLIEKDLQKTILMNNPEDDYAKDFTEGYKATMMIRRTQAQDLLDKINELRKEPWVSLT